MKKLLLGAAATISIAAISVPASAAVVFASEWNGILSGNCTFSTSCVGDQQIAAQAFTLTSAATITSASFTNIVFASSTHGQPTAANWFFLAADGTGGLPGTLLFSGSNSSILSKTVVGGDQTYRTVEEGFNLPSVSLGAGNYYFGFQAVSNGSAVYLAGGTPTSGAAQSNDFGTTWIHGYAGRDSVAVSLFDTSFGAGAVPEPATWAFMIFGFGAIGGAMRRQRKATVKVSYA